MQILKKIGNIVCIILIILLVISIIKNIRNLKSAGQVISEAQKQEEKLRKDEETLKKQIQEAESSEFIEKQLRDKLGYAKEGEIVIVLPPADELKKLAPPKVSEEESVPKSNWEKWKELFF